MSKLVKGLVVSTLAVSAVVLAGASPVSASAYYKDYKYPHFGSHSSSDIKFHENYDKATSFFYSLKEDEKKHDNEHYSFDSKDYNTGAKHHGVKKYDDKHDDKKHGGKYAKHDDKHDKKWGDWDKDKWCGCGGYGSSVSISYNKDKSYWKSFEEEKSIKARESYSSDLKQSSDHGKFGKHGGDFSNHSVKASVDLNKEYSLNSYVKAEVASSSSVNTNVSLNNYGPHGGHSNTVSAYEDANHYSKVQASLAEYQKQESSVNYSADNSRANFGGKHGGHVNSNSVDYSAHSSHEASKKVTYEAEESSSYSSGFTSNNSSWEAPAIHKAY